MHDHLLILTKAKMFHGELSALFTQVIRLNLSISQNLEQFLQVNEAPAQYLLSWLLRFSLIVSENLDYS